MGWFFVLVVVLLVVDIIMNFVNGVRINAVQRSLDRLQSASGSSGGMMYHSGLDQMQRLR